MGPTSFATTLNSQQAIFSTSVPPEVKRLTIAASTLDKTIFRRMLKVALASLQRSQNEQDCEAAFENICTALQCNTEEQAQAVAEQYSGVLTLLRAALRLNAATLRQQHLEANLCGLGLLPEQARDVCRVVLGPARAAIDEQLIQAAPSLPTLNSLDWNVQAALAPNHVPHLLEPVVALTLHCGASPNTNASPEEISGGSTTHHLTLSLSQYHQLRYTVANVLHQMEALETLPGGAKHSATPVAAASAGNSLNK